MMKNVIYIFGDIHVNKIHCPPEESLKKSIDIINFFAQLPNLKRDGKPLLIDYFFELPYIEKFSEPKVLLHDVALKKINVNFYKCLQRKKEDCQYKNVRMHYIDVRMNSIIYEIMNLLLYNDYLKVLIQIFEIIKHGVSELPNTLIRDMDYFDIDKDIINTYNINEVAKLSDILFRYNKIDWKQIENLSELNTQKILDILKINKQFDNIEYPQVFALFNYFFFNKLQIFFKTALDKDHIQFL